MEEAKKVTRFYRDAILAQVNKGIDFKKDDFYPISLNDFEKGKIHKDIVEQIFTTYEEENKKKNERTLPVIISVKTIRTNIEAAGKLDDDMEDLTGIFFVNAILDREECILKWRGDITNAFGWFPRECLTPLVEPELAIADAKKIDIYLSENLNEAYRIDTWQDFFLLNKRFYETITKYPLEENRVSNQNGKGEEILLESSLYLFLDQKVNPVHHIKALYDDLQKDSSQKLLYENLIRLEEQITLPLIPISYETRKQHVGQMGGMYELSPSQREGMAHYTKMDIGEVLAINGPPRNW